MREVASGVWESDMGLWQPDAAGLLRERRRFEAHDVAILINITPEFDSAIGSRSPAQVARSTAVSSLADGILVSGPMAGVEADISTLDAVRAAVPSDAPVILNTGAHYDMVTPYLKHCHSCSAGSSLKVDDGTRNPVHREPTLRFVDKVQR